MPSTLLSSNSAALSIISLLVFLLIFPAIMYTVQKSGMKANVINASFQ